MAQKLVVYFHGTCEDAARRIRKEGFHPHAAFDRTIDRALASGKHVFAVAFRERAPPLPTSFSLPRRVGVERIVGLTVFSHKRRYRNQELAKQIEIGLWRTWF